MTKTGTSDDNKGRVYGGENQEERRARRRQQFLDAGLQVFGTLGYRAATVRSLCKQAGLTDRYFYESFDTTEDLLVGVYRQQCEALERAVEAGSDCAPILQQLAAMRGAVHGLMADLLDGHVREVLSEKPAPSQPAVDETLALLRSYLK